MGITLSDFELSKEEFIQNKDLIADFGNLVAWIYLLNRKALNELFYEINSEGNFCTDLSELIKTTNVLGRFGKSKKEYYNII